MADQVFTVALDDKGFASGLARIDQQNKRVSERVESAWDRQGKSFANKWNLNTGSAVRALGKFGAGAAIAYRVAERALSAYKDEFPGVVSASQDFTGAVRALQVELGRNYIASGYAQSIASIGESARGALNSVLDFVQVLSTNGAEDGLGENRDNQKMIEYQTQQNKLMEDTLDLQIAQADAENRLGDAAELRARKQLHADQQRINGLAKGLASNDPIVLAARKSATASAAGGQASRLSNLNEQASDDEAELRADIVEASGDTLAAKQIRENLRYRKQGRSIDQLAAQGADVAGLRSAAAEAHSANLVRIAREEDSPAARMFKAGTQQDLARAGQVGTLQQAAERRRIEQLSLEGHEKEAALARVRLEFARQRAEIEEQDLVTTEEKVRLLDELATQEQSALVLTSNNIDRKNRAPTEVRTLAAGLGAHAAMVFGGVGGSGRGDTGRQQLTEAQKTNRLLEQIKANTQDGGTYN